MRTKRNLQNLVIAVAAVALTLGATMAPAQGAEPSQPNYRAPGEPGGDFGGGPGPFFLAERLDLTEQQKAEIEKIREEGRQQDAELRKQMLKLSNQMQGLLLEDEPDEGEVLKLNDQMGEIRTRLRGERLQRQLAVRKLLTPQQRDRMLLMRGEGRFGHNRERGPRCGQFDRPGRFGPGECDGHGPRGPRRPGA